MANNGWDPDEFLDFDYGRPVPDKTSDADGADRKASGLGSDNDSYDELKRYEELRRQAREEEQRRAAAREVRAEEERRLASRAQRLRTSEPKEATALRSERSAKASASRAERVVTRDTRDTSGTSGDAHRITDEEAAALRKARQDAYDRYRSTYKKNRRRQAASGGKNAKAGGFTKLLAMLYVIATAVFAAAVTMVDVLPGKILMLLFVVLLLLGIIIVIQLTRGNIRRWVRVLASFTAAALIVCFGMGSAYAFGTLSFLDFTSVSNENKVASVTEQAFNVVITGIDVRGTIDEQGRSDVNMIVTVNPKTGQILLTSIPRDYQIYMPDKNFAMDKLTHTGFYSVESTILAEEDLLDTTMNYYVKVNFSTVEKFIDAIGGIDVYSEYTFNPVKLKSWTVQEGMNHMNGRQALAFARERKAFPTGDNQRIKNQQAVFEAMIEKATSSNTMLLSYNKVISNLKDYFQMSFSSKEFRSFIKLQLAKNTKWKIYKNTIIGGDGSLPTYTTGGAYAYVMTQDQDSIDNAKALINAVLEGKTLAKDDDGNVYVKDSAE